jgi:hypothetical protein
MRWARLAAANHRGVLVPRILGLGLVAVALLGSTLLALVYASTGSRQIEAAGWGALGGSSLVFAAGLVDDLVPIGPRGLRNHLRSLASGHMTTGVLKVIVVGACSIVTVALEPVHPGWERAGGAILVAACANLWNDLDVAPGRALKWFLPVAVVGLAADWRLLPTIPALLLGGILALPADVRERAMLGDAGANLLGFNAGLGLYLVLPATAVWIAAGIAVGLNVLADTVTLSRLIRAVPPLRWLDMLGRISPSG